MATKWISLKKIWMRGQCRVDSSPGFELAVQVSALGLGKTTGDTDWSSRLLASIWLAPGEWGVDQWIEDSSLSPLSSFTAFSPLPLSSISLSLPLAPIFLWGVNQWMGNIALYPLRLGFSFLLMCLGRQCKLAPVLGLCHPCRRLQALSFSLTQPWPLWPFEK